jgi:hypothetical protein
MQPFHHGFAVPLLRTCVGSAIANNNLDCGAKQSPKSAIHLVAPVAELDTRQNCIQIKASLIAPSLIKHLIPSEIVQLITQHGSAAAGELDLGVTTLYQVA